jgi:TPP-dependent indolepyruvate ferredoxin oxidoreductase alpha subunit
MKNVGVHVAADALALGNLAGAHEQGGAVVIMGEDPWCDSTQVPADSRFICEHLRMPAVGPSDIQELKDWIALCFKLSQVAGCYIGYIVSTARPMGVAPSPAIPINTRSSTLARNSIWKPPMSISTRCSCRQERGSMR